MGKKVFSYKNLWFIATQTEKCLDLQSWTESMRQMRKPQATGMRFYKFYELEIY